MIYIMGGDGTGTHDHSLTAAAGTGQRAAADSNSRIRDGSGHIHRTAGDRGSAGSGVRTGDHEHATINGGGAANYRAGDIKCAVIDGGGAGVAIGRTEGQGARTDHGQRSRTTQNARKSIGGTVIADAETDGARTDIRKGNVT